MIDSIQAKLYSRLTGDITLVNLLGGSGRIYHALEGKEPIAGSLTYMMMPSVPNASSADSAQILNQYFQIMIFARNYNAVAERVYKLLENYRFSEPSDAGEPIANLDWIGEDNFDEALKVGRKDMRFRVLVIPKAVAPIS